MSGDHHADARDRKRRKDRYGHTSTNPGRARDLGGAVLVGQTTASEFGGVNVTRTVLNGITHNPWQHGKTPGGSSGGTAAAVSRWGWKSTFLLSFSTVLIL